MVHSFFCIIFWVAPCQIFEKSQEFQVSCEVGVSLFRCFAGENMAFTYPLLAEVMAVDFWSRDTFGPDMPRDFAGFRFKTDF